MVGRSWLTSLVFCAGWKRREGWRLVLVAEVWRFGENGGKANKAKMAGRELEPFSPRGMTQYFHCYVRAWFGRRNLSMDSIPSPRPPTIMFNAHDDDTTSSVEFGE